MSGQGCGGLSGPLIAGEYAQSELNDFASQMAAYLEDSVSQSSGFVVCVCGEMGCGKTTTVARVLWALGVDPHVPVTSPTYVYANYYDTDLGLIVHMDLHRLDRSHMDFFNLASEHHSLGAHDAQIIGHMIEWPERLNNQLRSLLNIEDKKSTGSVFELSIAYTAHPHRRLMSLARYEGL